MLETPGASLPPSLPPPKTKPWIIVLLVIVLFCCFCIGSIGLLYTFGEPILNELGLIHALLPGLIF